MFFSVTYFQINKHFDRFLQELINENNYIQSLIVFLSILSLINIFHPISLRKEVNMDDVRSKVKSSIIKAQEQEKQREEMKKHF